VATKVARVEGVACLAPDPPPNDVPRHRWHQFVEIELHRDWAVIDVPVSRSQRVFYRRNVDAAKIALPWAKQTSSR
jgi:hypothetical protein